MLSQAIPNIYTLTLSMPCFSAQMKYKNPTDLTLLSNKVNTTIRKYSSRAVI